MRSGAGELIDFRPDGLARGGPEFGTPPLGKSLDDQQPTTGLGLRRGQFRHTGRRQTIAAGVGHRDAEGSGAEESDGQPEVTAGDVTVEYGVVGELGDDLLGGTVRVPPLHELLHDETPGEAGTSWRGREQGREVAGRGSNLGDF